MVSSFNQNSVVHQHIKAILDVITSKPSEAVAFAGGCGCRDKDHYLDPRNEVIINHSRLHAFLRPDAANHERREQTIMAARRGFRFTELDSSTCIVLVQYLYNHHCRTYLLWNSIPQEAWCFIKGWQCLSSIWETRKNPNVRCPPNNPKSMQRRSSSPKLLLNQTSLPPKIPGLCNLPMCYISIMSLHHVHSPL